MELKWCVIVFFIVNLLLRVWFRETDNYFLEDRMAIEMGGRQEMGMDKFHAPTDEGVEVQNIQNSQSPS